jgi:hypothetical protein
MQASISKIIKAKRDGGMAQEVERLPSKCEILSSNSCTAKKTNKQKGDRSQPCTVVHTCSSVTWEADLELKVSGQQSKTLSQEKKNLVTRILKIPQECFLFTLSRGRIQ